jgi:hypothetical protein
MDKAWVIVFVAGILWIVGDFIVRIIKASKQSSGGHQMNKRFDDLESDLGDCEQDLLDALHRIEVLEKIVAGEKHQLHKDTDDLNRKDNRAG